MIKEELVLLDYRDKLKKDEKFKKEEDIKNSKPIPKLEWYTIPKSGKVDSPYLISDAQKPHLCQTCDGQIRMDIQNQVFKQPIAFQPTNTLEQHCHENEIEMKKNEVKKQKHEAQVEEEKRNETEDQKDEKEKKKQREWDDWKEFNAKGTGNMNGLWFCFKDYKYFKWDY